MTEDLWLEERMVEERESSVWHRQEPGPAVQQGDLGCEESGKVQGREEDMLRKDSKTRWKRKRTSLEL